MTNNQEGTRMAHQAPESLRFKFGDGTIVGTRSAKPWKRKLAKKLAAAREAAQAKDAAAKAEAVE